MIVFRFICDIRFFIWFLASKGFFFRFEFIYFVLYRQHYNVHYRNLIGFVAADLKALKGFVMSKLIHRMVAGRILDGGVGVTT